MQLLFLRNRVKRAYFFPGYFCPSRLGLKTLVILRQMRYSIYRK